MPTIVLCTNENVILHSLLDDVPKDMEMVEDMEESFKRWATNLTYDEFKKLNSTN